jgi:chemotaxis protein MotB
MKRRRSSPHVNHDRWLVSYADFITLLFAFFVVLYAAAEIDKKKMGKVAASIQVAFQQMGAFPATSATYAQGSSQVQGPPPLPPLALPEGHTPPPPSPPANSGGSATGSASQHNLEALASLQKELEKALAKEIARKEVAITLDGEGLVVSLREVGFFESGSAELEASSESAFRRMAELLARYDLPIRIEGHTDNVPIHNLQFHSNWELSTARATETVRLLITEYHISPASLSAAGYAEYHPVAGNETVDGRSQNRRVDLVVLLKQPAKSGNPAPR